MEEHLSDMLDPYKDLAHKTTAYGLKIVLDAMRQHMSSSKKDDVNSTSCVKNSAIMKCITFENIVTRSLSMI